MTQPQEAPTAKENFENVLSVYYGDREKTMKVIKCSIGLYNTIEEHTPETLKRLENYKSMLAYGQAL